MHRPAAPFRAVVFTGIFASVTVLPSLGLAQSNKTERAAEAKNDQGKRAFDRSDFETARQAFSQAYDLSAKPKYLKNIAAAELNLNRPLDALKHFKQFVRDPGTSREFVDQVKSLMDQAMARTGHLSVEAPAGTTLSIDGADTGEQTPLTEPIDVNPGSYAIQGQHNGKTANVRVQADPGKVTPVRLVFESHDPPPQVTATPVTGPQNAAISQTGSKPEGPAEPARESGGFKGPPLASWILGGVALAGVGTGVAFGLMSASKSDDYKSNPNACADPSSTACESANDARDAGTRNRTISYVGYGLGGGALIAGIVVWAVTPREASSAGSTVTPKVGGTLLPGGASIQLQGTF